MPEISDNFSMKADTAYFTLGSARTYNEQGNTAQYNVVTNVSQLEQFSPYSVVSNTLFSMKNSLKNVRKSVLMELSFLIVLSKKVRKLLKYVINMMLILFP